MIILLAYEATREGRDQLLQAPELAWLSHEQMHLLAVMPVPTGLFLGEGYVPPKALDEERAQAQLLVDQGLAELARRGFTAAGHLAFGEPAEEICRAARELHAGLIVVRHPRRVSFAARWWKGWVGSSILEQAPCSLLIVVSG
ncbi:MAG TPA: universal stress protein [Burkholderiales bacterium]|nr:universal stress protein [Burkholderiales bacterium]